MTKFIATLILPPPNQFLPVALAWLLAKSWPRLRRCLLLLTLVAHCWHVHPVTGEGLMRQPESGLPASINVNQLTADPDKATAIVVLGGGPLNAPEYSRDTAGRHTLERLRWAARLHRKLQMPILVTGGSPLGNASSEAEQMREVLVEDFGVPARWLETQSLHTCESAFNTQDMLRAESIVRIVLVTHAAHMPGSAFVFDHVGFEVVAAPTGFTSRSAASVLDYLPSAIGLEMGKNYFHEVIGIGWYHVRLIFAA